MSSTPNVSARFAKNRFRNTKELGFVENYRELITLAHN